MDEELLKSGREYARRMKMSFNALVRKLVRDAVRPSEESPFAESIRLMQNTHGHSGGWKWNRDEIYAERLNRHPKRD